MPSFQGFLESAENAIARLMEAAYRTWLSVVRGLVLAPYNRFRLSPDPNAIWSASGLWDRRMDNLIENLRQIARRGWMDAADDIGEDLPFDPSSEILSGTLQQTRNLMVRTPHEVYRRVIAELAKGGTIDQKAARVSALLDYTGTENWPSRARTVAVTEVNRAYAFGGLAAAQRLQYRIGVLFKRWDAKRDAATRTAHKRAHGQNRAVSQPFIVDGEALMAPLDPAGSAENVINCRCRATYSRRS